nr:MAG TPA: Proteasome ATP-independent Activator [Bacteriophage sp.]
MSLIVFYGLSFIPAKVIRIGDFDGSFIFK